MEMGDEEEDEVAQRVFDAYRKSVRHVDLNDNSRLVSRMDQYKLRPLGEEQGKCPSAHGSPRRCPTTSTTSDLPGTGSGALLYSPEDTINNDFFYDDEFAVQFDATLGGAEEEIIDSVELQTLMHITEDDNQRWRSVGRMSSSKSDSCLYQAELDLSGNSDGIGTSSEREFLSSSDLSDFKVEPLFSPPPPHGDMDDSTTGFPSDSLCNEELAGSLVKDEDRFAFNWLAAKDQYMISFDRSPTKYSSDDSYHEPPNKKPPKQLMCWGQPSTSSGSGAYSTASSGSRRTSDLLSSTCNSGSAASGSGIARSSSGGTGSGSPLIGKHSQVSGSNGSLSVSPFSHAAASSNDSGRQSSTDTSTSSTMTTWKLVKQQCNKGLKDSLPDGMTTWQRVKENGMTGSKTTRSKSMPELPPPQSTPDSALEPPSEAPCDVSRPKRHSASLLEMYQRMKSCPGDVMAYREPEEAEEEPVVHFEIDTWSISPASSHQFSPMSEYGKAITDTSLIKWNTRKNLSGYEDPSLRTKVQNNNVEMAVQAGSMLADSHKRLKPRQNIAVQHPPKLSDRAMQTSAESAVKPHQKTKENKSLQTSIDLLATAHWNVQSNILRKKRLVRMARPHSAGSIPRKYADDDPFTVQLSKNAKERMTQSLFFNSTDLPDLSFLKKETPCSLANITQAITEPPAGAKMPLPKKPTKPSSGVPPVPPKSGYRPKKPPRQSRPHSACLAQSRESSPLMIGKLRSRSSDSASSFCSSSSSGIDPGSYDSLNNRPGRYISSRWDENHRRHVECGAKVIMAKDSQRNLSGEGAWPIRNRDECSKVCNLCQAQRSTESQKADSGVMTASHPSYSKTSGHRDMFEVRSWEGCGCHQRSHCSHYRACSGIYHCPCVTVPSGCHTCLPPPPCYQVAHVQCHKPPPRVSATSEVRMRRDCRSKPLKSCLVKERKVDRKLLAFKHRSWSDPSDGLVLKYSQEGQIKYQLVTHDKECARRQPLSEIPIHSHNPEGESNDENQETGKSTAALPNKVKPIESPVKNIDGVIIHSKRNLATPSNSPEAIPIPPCTCGTTHAVLHSSSDSGDGGSRACSDFYKSKKSVSFSEEVYYHSPYQSPHESPRRQVQPPASKDTGTGVVIRHPLGRLNSGKKRPVSLPPDFRMVIPKPVTQTIEESPGSEGPPQQFEVSPLSSISLMSSPTTGVPSIELAAKKELLQDMMKATEKLIHYFGQTRDVEQKAELGSTSASPDIGHVLLEHFCPVVYAVILDGLKPLVRSLFGKVKNSVWKVVEDSLEIGPHPSSKVVHHLVQDLKSLDFLTTSWLKFNAFVFGLLNHKALDVWLSQVQSNDKLLSRHYETDGFLRLSQMSAAKPLFLDLITVLQPLAQMPFRLEYNFEFRHLEGRQHQQLSDTILDRHLLRGAEGELERRRWHLYQHQSERLGDLSQSDSPVRGEISPVQGQRGRAEGVLHHSAPDVYDPKAIVSWSPTRSSWHSLYDKIQEQTKIMVTDTGKQLLKSLKDSKKIKLSKDVLQNLGQDFVQVAVGYSSPLKALPAVPGLTESSDTTLSGQSSCQEGTLVEIGDTVRPRKALAVSDSEIAVSSQAESDDDEKDSDGLLKRLTEHWFSSPQKVYKHGVTEYRFREERDSVSPEQRTSVASSHGNSMQGYSGIEVSNRSKDTDTGCPSTHKKSIFDEHGMPRSSSLDHAPVKFQIPSRSQSLDSPSGESSAPPLLNKAPTSRAQNECGQTKTLKSRSQDNMLPSETLTRTLSSSLKKSWSSFGPSLVSFMDRLLLDDKVKSKEQAMMTSNPEMSKDWAGSTMPQPKLTRATTVATCDSEDVDGSSVENLLGMTTAPGRNRKVEKQATPSPDLLTPPTEEVEHNWFVQALCHHVAMQEDQLSFSKGTILAVMKQVESDWLLCRHGDKEGLVHRVCVTNA